MVNFVRNIYNKIIDKSIYAYKIVFSSRRKMLRWTFGLNLAMLLACFVIRRDQINGIVTSQVQEFSQVEIPRFLRKPLYGAYSKYYDLNVDEIELSFKDYQTFSAFFTRKINRKAAEEMPNTISSPCDGKILKISEITGDSCHIIKNSYYSLSQLVLGDSKLLKESQSIEQFLKIRKENKIYQVIIYLAPGDYHRFHSPVNMNILKIKSIDGKFQPVNENSLIKSKAIYEKNVRKVLFGKWSSGLLTMVMVGALNVSKIKIHDIKQLKRGEQLGYFNLGSTIVLLMEAKGIKEWHIKEGQKVQYGQSLLEFIL